ncbi:MAG TPA: GWxTD domain-containing protein, partial [Candidatus Krumholzibacterium sp.]|nr:GWxTD domain-containing protein [Candidatus Krumholzibacterium sp.]
HNERKKEHETRTELALKMFPKKDPPGWDDRGEVLIRFGMPDSRERIWSHIGRFEQKMPGEIWKYDSPLMLATFTDHYLNGEYYWNYNPAGEESWTDFYREGGFGKSSRMIQEENEAKYRDDPYIVVPNTLPVHIDPHMTDQLNMFNPDMLDYIASNRTRGILFPALKEHIEDDYRRADKALTGFHTNMIREKFLHYPDLDLSMPAFFDICCFNAGNGKVRTEINFEVPVEELELVRDNDRISAEVELRVLARDIDMREIASNNEHVAFHAPASSEVTIPRFLPGQIVLTLEPGYYRFGIETVDPATGRRGVFCSSRRIEPKIPDLCMSDIMFAKQITSEEKPSRYMKGNLTVVPHPLHLYRRTYPLIFYFEIYGLATDRDDFVFYSLDYSIEPLEKKRTGPVLEEIRTVISSGFETSGYGSTQPQRLEIATDELWEGPFRLKVRVMDRRTRRVVSQTANFSILE